MKKNIEENIAVQISPEKNIEALQEKPALETLMSLIAEGKINIPGVENNADFLLKLQTKIHTPAKNIELENQLKHIETIKHEVEFSAKKTEIEKKQLAAQKDAFLKRINNFKEENDKTKAELEEQKLELEAKGKMLLQAQDEIAVKQQALETKEKLILENSDIDAKLESLATLKEELRLESLKKLEEMREFKETKDQIKSELDDRAITLEARERELEEKEMSLAQSQVKESKKVAQETGDISPEILQSKVVQDMIVKVLMPQIKAQMIIEQQQRDERGDEDDSNDEDSIEVVEEGTQTNLVETFDATTECGASFYSPKLIYFLNSSIFPLINRIKGIINGKYSIHDKFIQNALEEDCALLSNLLQETSTILDMQDNLDQQPGQLGSYVKKVEVVDREVQYNKDEFLHPICEFPMMNQLAEYIESGVIQIKDGPNMMGEGPVTSRETIKKILIDRYSQVENILIELGDAYNYLEVVKTGNSFKEAAIQKKDNELHRLEYLIRSKTSMLEHLKKFTDDYENKHFSVDQGLQTDLFLIDSEIQTDSIQIVGDDHIFNI